jgi:hypothetical protein
VAAYNVMKILKNSPSAFPKFRNDAARPELTIYDNESWELLKGEWTSLIGDVI